MMLTKLAKYMHDHRLQKCIDTIRLGWNNYSFVFYIGSASAIIGTYLGVAGILALFVGMGFFYYAGKYHRLVEVYRKGA